MSYSRIRKHDCELTVADLEQHAVWEFTLDEKGGKRRGASCPASHSPARTVRFLTPPARAFTSLLYARIGLFDQMGRCIKPTTTDPLKTDDKALRFGRFLKAKSVYTPHIA